MQKPPLQEQRMLSDNTVLRRAQDVTYQSLGENQDTVILSLDTGQLYTCNHTAEDFLSAVDGTRSFADIIELLAQQFDAPPTQIQEDMSSLAEQMIKEGLILPVQQTDA